MRALPLLLLSSTLARCGLAPTDELQRQDVDPEPPPNAQTSRFEGLWLVDQPYHALYEATFYELDSDGRLTQGRSFAFDREEDLVTGSVGRDNGGTCQFARHWRAVDESTLAVGGDCDDQLEREIVLRFESPPEEDFRGAQVTVGPVGGEDGWDHIGFDWRFLKCPSEAACAPGLLDPEMTIDGSDLYFCHCHHGYGPGVDGQVSVTVDNRSDQAVGVSYVRLLLIPTDGGPVITAGDNANMRLRSPHTDNIIPPSSQSPLTLSVYIDPAGSEELIRPGDYRLELTLRIGATEQTAISDIVDIPIHD